MFTLAKHNTQKSAPCGSIIYSKTSISSKLKLMLKVLMNFRMLMTLSSTAAHLTSNSFKWDDIAAEISVGFHL